MSAPPQAVSPQPWERSADDIATEIGADIDAGLSSTEAAARLTTFGPNVLAAAPPVPWWRRLAAQFSDPLVVLLLVAIAISLLAWGLEDRDEVPFDSIVIAAIVAANAFLGLWQEARAEQAVAALQRMAAAQATVVRDGHERTVPTDDVVPGDVLALDEGDAVSADARVVDAKALRVAEAALTGESEPVDKSEDVVSGPTGLGDRVNMVFKGTTVSAGRGRAVVTATGMATEMGRIATLLEGAEDEKTPLQREIARVGRFLGIAVVVITVVVVVAILLVSDIESASDLVEVLLVGVSLAVAAVPEGLPAILSVVLALGVQRMAKQRAVVKRLSSVETLGSASVICSDKTGTLTENEMTIVKVATPSVVADVTGTGYRPVGDVRVDGRMLDDGTERAEVERLVGGGSLANNASLWEQDGTWHIQGDPTEAAFLVAERKLGIVDRLESRFRRVDEVPFTSERKLMSTVELDAAHDDAPVLVTKGAPDVLLARCTHVRTGSEVHPLTEERRGEHLARVDQLADLALRTLAVAYRRLDEPQGPADQTIEDDLTYLGTVGIIDPPRPEARLAIAESKHAGIRIIMITGDHPRTAVRIAGELGIVGADAPVVTGIELDGLDRAGVTHALADTSVFARVAPEHKLELVDALQEQANVVAMTGDGVNDAPALKEADIGVAMGITGTDVSKEAADMILADDNFATIVAAVREGRGIFSAIRKFLRYLLSSNIGEVLTMFFGVLLAGVIGLSDSGETIAAPLLATQILWINLVTDSAPALALGVDPPIGNVMERPPRRLTDRVIDREMQAGVFFIGLVMAVVTLIALDMGLRGGVLGGNGDIVEGRTMAFTTLVLAQLFNAFNARSARASAFERPFHNPLLWAAVAFSLGLQVLVVQVSAFNSAFETTPLSIGQWLVAAALASAVLFADEVKKLIVRTRAGPGLA